MPPRRTVAAALWTLLLALPAWAHAQDAGTSATPEATTVTDPTTTPDQATAARDAEGRGLFEAGRAAFEDGRYEDAVGYFDRAYQLSHRAQLLYNIGSAYDRLRRDAEALAAFEQYVRELPDAANVREVEARMRVLREAVAEHTTAEPDASETVVDVPEQDTGAVASVGSETAQTPPPPSAPHDDGPGVVGEWWLWTLVGVVAVGGVVTAVVLATQPSGVVYPAYDQGTEGTTMTLTVAF